MVPVPVDTSRPPDICRLQTADADGMQLLTFGLLLIQYILASVVSSILRRAGSCRSFTAAAIVLFLRRANHSEY